MFRAIRLCCLFLFAMPPLAVRADMSPEMYQLAWEIRRNFESDSSQATRGPECKEDCFRLANEALRDMLKREALNRVVVQALEDGAKFALSALGAPGVAISTYNVVQCYLNESSQAGFKACLIRETIGLVGGEALQRAGGWDELSSSLAGLAWDKAFSEIRTAVEGYQNSGEFATHAASRDCTVNVSLRWDKRKRAGANGGQIFVHFTFSDCRCPTGASSVRQGTLSFYVPVNLAPAGSGQPGWSIGDPQEYKLRAACCNTSYGDGRTHLYNSAFQWQGLMKDPGEETPPSTPEPPPPTPPPPVEPEPVPPPQPQWSEENPCPECQPFLDLALQHQRQARELETQMQEQQRQIDTNRHRQLGTRARIERIQKELAAKAGEGGSSYDPETGFRVDSWTQADGSVKVTVKDKNGDIIDEHTRPRRDTKKLQQQLEQEQAELERLEAEAAALQAELARLTQGRETQLKLERDARQALADCIREKCLGGIALLDDQKPKACTFPAVQAIAIGPRAQFGEKSLEQKAQDKAMGVVGDLVGGAIGGGGLGGFGKSPKKSGSKQSQGPDTVKDPVKNKLELTSGGTRIKTGLAPDPKGGTRVSVDVKDSPAQGSVHTIHRETLDRDCQKQVQMPSDYWLYKIWLDWKLTVTWTKDTYVDNQLVKHEEGGWQEEGRTMLDSGIFDASKDIPYTAWGQLGFDRPFAGPREVGATFKDVQPGVRERYVIHVAEPQNDPVTTTPFVVYPVKNSEGKMEFTDREPDWSALMQ
jgi:cell division protein FtsB